MSIRLRLTLVYSAILALTLVAFGLTLYIIQARTTLDALQHDLTASGDQLARSILWRYEHPDAGPNPGPGSNSEPLPPPPSPAEFQSFSGEPGARDLRERGKMRVLDPQGALYTSPFGGEQEALPLSAEGLQTLRAGSIWWETAVVDEEKLLIYNRPVVSAGEVVYIVQAARPLTDRDHSLTVLGSTLLVAGLFTILIAFGVGWTLAGITLRPIHRITQTAQAIGSESDFTRRVDYNGPKDEIGELAQTFNDMLTQLQQAYQRVSQALRLQRDFVADVSHELRTPLTTVRGNLALLRRQPPLPIDDQFDILTDLEAESDRLIRLVNDLLALARADSRQGFSSQPLPVGAIVEEACRQAQSLDNGRNILQSVPDDLHVLGDRDALKQVLLILLDNALKYSAGDIQVSAEENGSQVEICVQDHGAGISPELLPHIFDRFYRASTHASIPGIGLGLPIARALVEGQGGAILLASQPGVGSTVRVYLPLAKC